MGNFYNLWNQFFIFSFWQKKNCPRVTKLGQIISIFLYKYLAIWMIKLSYTKIGHPDSGSPRLIDREDML